MMKKAMLQAGGLRVKGADLSGGLKMTGLFCRVDDECWF